MVISERPPSLFTYRNLVKILDLKIRTIKKGSHLEQEVYLYLFWPRVIISFVRMECNLIFYLIGIGDVRLDFNAIYWLIAIDTLLWNLRVMIESKLSNFSHQLCYVSNSFLRYFMGMFLNKMIRIIYNLFSLLRFSVKNITQEYKGLIWYTNKNKFKI